MEIGDCHFLLYYLYGYGGRDRVHMACITVETAPTSWPRLARLRKALTFAVLINFNELVTALRRGIAS